MNRLNNTTGVLTLSSTLEEETDNEHLKARHGNHHQALDDTEIEDSPFRTPHGAEVAVLSGTEVLLVSGDGR